MDIVAIIMEMEEQMRLYEPVSKIQRWYRNNRIPGEDEFDQKALDKAVVVRFFLYYSDMDDILNYPLYYIDAMSRRYSDSDIQRWTNLEWNKKSDVQKFLMQKDITFNTLFYVGF